MEIQEEYQAYLAWLGPPGLVILVGALAALRPPRTYPIAAVLTAIGLITFLFATSQDRYCFDPVAEDCDAFLLAGLAGWPLSVGLIALVLVPYVRSRRGSSADGRRG